MAQVIVKDFGIRPVLFGYGPYHTDNTDIAAAVRTNAAFRKQIACMSNR